MNSANSLKLFTLIELLIVVAIIGILVTLLMPSLAGAREKAKVAVCLSNIAQQVKHKYAFALSNDNTDVSLSQFSIPRATKKS